MVHRCYDVRVLVICWGVLCMSTNYLIGRGIVCVSIVALALHFIHPLLPIIVALGNSIHTLFAYGCVLFNISLPFSKTKDFKKSHIIVDVAIDGSMWLVAITTYLFL